MYDAARALFDAKAATVTRACNFRAGRAGLHPADRADVLQSALLHLWRNCLQASARGIGAAGFSGEYSAKAGWAAHVGPRQRDRRRLNGRHVLSLATPTGVGEQTVGDTVSGREPHVDMSNGLSYTPADVQIDHPAALELLADGVDTGTVCHRLRLTRERVRQLAPRLGGVQVDGHHWLFPADTGRTP